MSNILCAHPFDWHLERVWGPEQIPEIESESIRTIRIRINKYSASCTHCLRRQCPIKCKCLPKHFEPYGRIRCSRRRHLFTSHTRGVRMCECIGMYRCSCQTCAGWWCYVLASVGCAVSHTQHGNCQHRAGIYVCHPHR